MAADNPGFFSEQVFEARRFSLPLIPKGGFEVVCGGAERVARDYVIERRSFPYVGIEFVAAGRGTLMLATRQIDLTPGIFFCYAGQIEHRIRGDERSPMVKYFVDLSGTGVRPLLKRAGLTPGTSARSSVPQRIIAIFEELIRAGLDGGANVRATCRSLAEALVWRLTDRASPGSARGESASFENYLRCRRELERSAATTRSLAELAECCGVSEEYLCRLFKRFDTDSPYRRLVRLRIAQAAALLAQGLSVTETADRLGFVNPFHFSRQFKAIYGVAPSKLTSNADAATGSGRLRTRHDSITDTHLRIRP